MATEFRPVKPGDIVYSLVGKLENLDARFGAQVVVVEPTDPPGFPKQERHESLCRAKAVIWIEARLDTATGGVFINPKVSGEDVMFEPLSQAWGWSDGVLVDGVRVQTRMRAVVHESPLVIEAINKCRGLAIEEANKLFGLDIDYGRRLMRHRSAIEFGMSTYTVPKE